MNNFLVQELLNNIFSVEAKYIIFGAGGIGKDIYCFLEKKLEINCFIDNDVRKIGSQIENVKVESFTYLNNNFKSDKFKIIIATNIYIFEIRKQLEDIGLIYNRDFFYYKNFISLYMWRSKKELWLNKTDIMITSRCTLKCKHCGMLMPYYERHEDRDISVLKEDIRTFFSIVDGVREFSILGGEPFLHPRLGELVEFICQDYRDKISSLQVITNATVLIDETLLNVLSKNSVQVAVSDYSNTVKKISKKVERFIKHLEQNDVLYKKLSVEKWVDLGSPENINNLTDGQLKKFFDLCATQCRGLFEKKLYYCSVNCSAVNSKKVYGLKSDYMDLSQMKNNISDKEKLLAFDLGSVEKGYVSYCNYCKGEPSVNDNYVIAAEQL